MRGGFGQFAVAAAVLLGGVAPAHALNAKATLANGVVSVSGGQAVKSTPISWDGVAVTTANKGGTFSFVSSYVPADCVGVVSDGVSSIDVRVEGCSGSITGLPGTGQVTIYTPGDDADVAAGGPLTYQDNGNGTISDLRTGLTWEKKTDANVNEVYSWLGAFAYVAELNAMNGGVGFGGYNDWRVPNVRELLSIVNYGVFYPSIHPIFGPTAGRLNYVMFWSSTSWAGQPESSAWGVNFRESIEDLAGMLPFGKTSALRVRAVRGGL